MCRNNCCVLHRMITQFEAIKNDPVRYKAINDRLHSKSSYKTIDQLFDEGMMNVYISFCSFY